MKLVPKIFTVMTLCAAAACGSNNSNPPSTSNTTDGNSTTSVGNGNAIDGNTAKGGSLAVLTVSGTISNFAFDTSATINDTSTLQVGVLNPNALYPNGTLNVLSPTAVKASDCTTTAGVRSCKFSISNVDTSAFSGGLLVVTADNRVSAATGDTTQWQTLATLVTPTALSAAQATGTLEGVAAYGLSSSGRTAFANLAGTASAGVTTTGAVIGLVTGSDGVTPVAGATLVTTAAKDGALNSTAATVGGIFYANAAVTAGSATGPTSANGLFLAVPASKTANALQASDSITPPAGATQTWIVPTTPAVSPLWLVVNLAAK